MEFKLTLEISLGLSQYFQVTNKMSDSLSKCFAGKYYGNGISSIFINLVCVSPEFEQFFKQRKPTYKKGIGMSHQDVVEMTLENTLWYDVIINYNLVINSNADDLHLYLKESIISSLSIIRKKRIKEFNLDKFIIDLSENI